MGNFTSQYLKNAYYDSAEVHAESKVASRPGTPLPTPKHRILENDPRSPGTDEILRTPMEVPVGLSYCREVEQISKGIATFQLQDPRSPTYGIPRTPMPILPVEVIPPSSIATSSESKRIFLETDLDETPEEESIKEDVINTDFMGIDMNLSPITAPSGSSPIKVMSNAVDKEPQLLTVKVTEICVENQIAGVAKAVPTVVPSKLSASECYTPLQTHNRANRKWNDKENGGAANLKKQLFNTPENKRQALNTPDKNKQMIPKARTPLGLMATSNSPMQILRDKQIQNVNKAIPSPVHQFKQLRVRPMAELERKQT